MRKKEKVSESIKMAPFARIIRIRFKDRSRRSFPSYEKGKNRSSFWPLPPSGSSRVWKCNYTDIPVVAYLLIISTEDRKSLNSLNEKITCGVIVRSKSSFFLSELTHTALSLTRCSTNSHTFTLTESFVHSLSLTDPKKKSQGNPSTFPTSNQSSKMNRSLKFQHLLVIGFLSLLILSSSSSHGSANASILKVCIISWSYLSSSVLSIHFHSKLSYLWVDFYPRYR